MSEKQIARVLDAVAQGIDTSCSIAAATGIPQSSVSQYLARLRANGLIKVVGAIPTRGRPQLLWAAGGLLDKI